MYGARCVACGVCVVVPSATVTAGADTLLVIFEVSGGVGAELSMVVTGAGAVVIGDGVTAWGGVIPVGGCSACVVDGGGADVCSLSGCMEASVVGRPLELLLFDKTLVVLLSFVVVAVVVIATAVGPNN